MTELSTEARAILEAGQAGLSPSAATKASVLSAVEGNIAGAAHTTSLGASATAGVASLKIVLALVLAVGVGGGIWLARAGSFSDNSNETNTESASISTNTVPSEKARDRAVLISDNHEKLEGEIALLPTPKEETTITKSPTAPPPSVELKPAGNAQKQTVAKIDQRQKIAPNRSAQAERKTRPTLVRSTLADEQKLIAAAQVAIRKADYSEALGLLKNHESQFPKGILAPERNAASAIAGCLSEQRGSKAAGRRFLTNHAHSPLASRVRSSCKLP